MTTEINILFGATSDYLPYATVTALSAIDKISKNYKIDIHYLYADIIKPISDKERECYFCAARDFFADRNVNIKFYDISDKLSLLDGQNIGMWGKVASLTHYFYLLSPLVLDCDKCIYLDTDMIVNCDLSNLIEQHIRGGVLITMASPSGFEVTKDQSNSGFSILNLDLWRKENTLDSLLEFGRQLPKCVFCDQNLLYQYFNKAHPDRIGFVDKMYNTFAPCFPEKLLSEMLIIHYTGLMVRKPWDDFDLSSRGKYLWWQYARQSPFYEKLLYRKFLYDFKRDFKSDLKNLFRSCLSYSSYKRYQILAKILRGKQGKHYKDKLAQLDKLKEFLK